MRPAAVVAAARADFRERSRRPAFVVALAATLSVGYGVHNGTISLRLGDHRGVFNAAWIGGMLAVVCATLVTLVGFYLVKNAVERDRAGGVGELLAATPLGKVEYLMGKFLSNAAVLAAIVALVALSGMGVQLLRGEDRTLDLAAIAVPFLLVALPAVLFTAAVALLFETLPGLRGGFGNVLWFFLWAALLAVPLQVEVEALDVTGIVGVQRSMRAALLAAAPDAKEGFSLTIGGEAAESAAPRTFLWTGLDLDASFVAARAAVAGMALLLALAAAVPFDRFARDRVRLVDRVRGKRRRGADAAAPPEAPSEFADSGVVRSLGLGEGAAAALAAAAGSAGAGAAFRTGPLAALSGLPALVAAELRLLLKGQPWWWWAGAAGLVVAGLTVAPAEARAKVLPFAMLWPVLVWSPLGVREQRAGTAGLLQATPGSAVRMTLGAWLAGAAVGVAILSGLLLRTAVAGDLPALAAHLAGALFVPALALAAGSWSGSARLFEAGYTLLWYVGPLQPTPALDLLGVGAAHSGVGSAARWLALALLLVGASVIRRRRRG